MVYLRNIINQHSSLQPSEVLVLHFKSGDTTEVRPKSKLEVCSGDLKITTQINERRLGSDLMMRVVIVDCAEVEKISLMRRKP